MKEFSSDTSQATIAASSSTLTKRARGIFESGTGLGLAIVRHVLLRHHATLDIASVPDHGSTFTVHFPATQTIADYAEQ